MKPIETMAQAYVEAEPCSANYETMSTSQKKVINSGLRAALLALAEADLPVAAEGRELSIMDHAVFRAMLRTIFRDCDQ
jgi:pyrimidine deaminase RibD-like protein